MPIETAADRAVFLNADEFGASAVYTPAAGGGASDPIAGQFDDPSRASSLGAIGAIDAVPTFFCQVADLPGAAVGDAGDVLAIAGGYTWQVTAIEPDGTGMALLRLAAAD